MRYVCEETQAELLDVKRDESFEVGGSPSAQEFYQAYMLQAYLPIEH